MRIEKVVPGFWIKVLGVLPALFGAFSVFGQFSLQDTVPVDQRVIRGSLENGLTYYIQQNPKPEAKLELRLVVNAGSVLEDERQLGLAHFVEHMAFNGSEHFEKNELISYLQSIGVSFGADLNAYTSFDETVYILPIPTDDPEKLLNGFAVLRDWAGGLLLTEEDIDAERSIIVEEWRTGQGVDQRLRDQYLPVLLQGSMYADRLPIGDMDIIRNAPYEDLRRFYRDWYRPDNMAVVAVGDVDPDEVLELIREYFGDLENRPDAPERMAFEVPEHVETLITVLTDEEAPGIQLQLFYKHKPSSSLTVQDYKDRMVRLMLGGMLTQRLDEIRQRPQAPFVYAGARYGSFVRDLDFFTTTGAVTSGNTLRGVESFLMENERVLRHGFTESELDRVKRSLSNSSERAFQEMDKMESRSIVGRYVSNYLTGAFAEGEANRYRLYSELLPAITVEDVNQMAKRLLRDQNRVLIVTASDSDKEDLPSEEALRSLFEQVKHMDLEPYQEEEVPEVLLSMMPQPGRVLDTEVYDQVEVTAITLQNGMRVFFKPTDYKNDEIIFTGSSKGGASLYPDEDHYAASYASVMVNVMGIGDFSPTALRKVLAGKNVSVTPNISTYGETISGSTSPRDLELALQLMHLYFTSPRTDRELFEVYLENQRNQLETAQANPDFQFNKRLNQIVNQGNIRGMGIFDPDQLDLIDLDRGMEIYRERFANAGNFEFLFTGNLDLEEVIPLVSLYLGSLPGDPTARDTPRDLGIRIPRGLSERIEVGRDDKSQVILYFSGPTDYDLDKSQQVSYLGEILTIRLIESLREETGGVYGVGARGGLARLPEESFSFSISFPCSPDNVEMLTELVWEEVRKIQQNGPEEQDLLKVRESKRINLEENMKRNGFWHGQLQAAISAEMPLETILGARDRILGVTADEVKAVANAFLQKEHLLEITRFPISNKNE
ncbi:MAG: insulinase family protein [Lunatimonas sp.]|uniref:M16 family metallopeptidase n=1 Tax=Lunatimonas sp. TaxID=2060141 RepID=UPI00263A7B95|nr:insulinase family protein [Lunatimonas sp.]MCC5939439.1 insulinase family protein [Lunatimonas sp.]